MYTIFHKLTRTSAIALAVISISGTAVAESISNDSVADSRQIPARTTHAFDPNRRTHVPDVATTAPSASLTSVVPGKSNRAPAELLMLGIPGTGKDGNRLKAGVDNERVANTPGNRDYDNIFNHPSTPATVNWVVAQKCGWICVVRKF